MKISKRQLKRIIREEYSKLKERGLINEMPLQKGKRGSMRGYMKSRPVPSAKDMYIEQLIETLHEYRGGPVGYMDLEYDLSMIIPDFDAGDLGLAISHALKKGMIEATVGPDGLGMFTLVMD